MAHSLDHGERTRPAPPPGDRMAQLRALVDDFVAHGTRLRRLHEHYMTLQHEGMSSERRQEVRRILSSELDLLAESYRIQQEIDGFLHAEHETLRARMLADALRSDETSETP